HRVTGICARTSTPERRMRTHHLWPLAAGFLVLACDFNATGTGDPVTGPSSTQLAEVARAITDDLESETQTLTLTVPGAPMGITFAGACPDSSNGTDADGDGVLDDAVLTYAGSACT